MRVWKFAFVAAVVGACFAGGLYGGPAVRAAYARMFPEPQFTSGDFSKLHAEAGSPVVLFSTSTCPYCKKARELLDKAGIAYVDYVTDKSEDADKKFQQLGGGGVPLIYIGDRRIRGFREPAINDALAQLAPAKTVPSS